MKTNRFAMFGALALAAAFAVTAAAQEAVAVNNDAFSVALPAGYAEFSKQVQKADSPEGEIETTNWISKSPTGEAVIVTVSRMPGKILDPKKMIESTRASLIKSLGATVESEEDRPGDLPSTRLLFRSQGAVFRARLLVRDDTLYQLLYVGRSEEQRSNAGVANLFESFRLAPPPAASAPTATLQ